MSQPRLVVQEKGKDAAEVMADKDHGIDLQALKLDCDPGKGKKRKAKMREAVFAKLDEVLDGGVSLQFRIRRGNYGVLHRRNRTYTLEILAPRGGVMGGVQFVRRIESMCGGRDVICAELYRN